MSDERFPEHLAIDKRFPGSVLDWHAQHGDRTLIVDGERILDIARLLKTELGYHFLVDLAAVDYLPRKPRFEVVYQFMNLDTKARLRVKVQSDELHPEVPSLTPLWPIANWLEREVWDLMGVTFRDHPNLKRILLYEEFEGHPLRKDYPRTGRQPLIGPKD
ncbi:MAG TPA: NADH-quinone oxidoreductase subunit C [bacterium]|jgi:NADH-quinone oxidoreductase subunit C